VAATKTQVGSTLQGPPQWVTIRRIRIGQTQPTNAESYNGVVHVEVADIAGPFIYAHGNGVGGASNSHAIAAEVIDCKIPVPPSDQISVYIEDVDAGADVTVSLEYEMGGSADAKIRSYGGISTGGATGADTEESMGYQVITKSGFIRELRFGMGDVVDGTSPTGILRLLVPGWGHDLKFAVGHGAGGATLGGPAHADVIKDLAIPVVANQMIYVYITMADITRSPTYSFQVE